MKDVKINRREFFGKATGAAVEESFSFVQYLF